MITPASKEYHAKKEEVVMNVKLLSILLVLSMLVTLTSCTAIQSVDSISAIKSELQFEQITSTAFDPDVQFITASNKIGFDWLRSSDLNKNHLLSPLSLSIALAMLQNGADLDTRDGILSAMNLSNHADTEINEAYNALMASLSTKYSDSESMALKVYIANSFWLREDIEPKQHFIDTLKQTYDADVFHADFSDSKTVDLMNKWIEDHTEGLLKDTLKELSVEAIAYLMNTVYFKGAWLTPFSANATLDHPFSRLNGGQVNVPMMQNTSFFDYSETEDVQIAIFPYYDGMQMKVILPKGDLDIWLEDNDSDAIQTLLANSTYNRARLQILMPKFEYFVNNELNDFLISNGMSQAFDETNANFKPMIELATDNVYISRIFQNCKIINDEKGTEAAAVTVVEIEATSAMPDPALPIPFECDRPFLYIIEDTETQTALFTGVVADPSAD